MLKQATPKGAGVVQGADAAAARRLASPRRRSPSEPNVTKFFLLLFVHKKKTFHNLPLK